MIHPQASSTKSTRNTAKAATNRAAPGYANKEVHFLPTPRQHLPNPAIPNFLMETFNEASN